MAMYNPNFETLTTERLLLRKWTADDFRSVFAHCSDEQLMELLGITTKEQLEIERTKQQNGGFSSYNKKFAYFQILDKQTNQFLGWCGYHTWYTDHARAEVGYNLVDEAMMGKGIMSEALHAVIAYGFEQMGLERIEALIGPNNIPSLKLAAKFGFQKEGLLREHYRRNGLQEDSVVFGLLKREWEALKK